MAVVETALSSAAVGALMEANSSGGETAFCFSKRPLVHPVSGVVVGGQGFGAAGNTVVAGARAAGGQGDFVGARRLAPSGPPAAAASGKGCPAGGCGRRSRSSSSASSMNQWSSPSSLISTGASRVQSSASARGVPIKRRAAALSRWGPAGAPAICRAAAAALRTALDVTGEVLVGRPRPLRAAVGIARAGAPRPRGIGGPSAGASRASAAPRARAGAPAGGGGGISCSARAPVFSSMIESAPICAGGGAPVC